MKKPDTPARAPGPVFPGRVEIARWTNGRPAGHGRAPFPPRWNAAPERRTGRAAIVTDSDSPAPDPPGGPLDRFVRAFYDARREAARAGDPGRLEPFIADDVRWREPDVGAHMGDLRGRDAVLDMIRRALATTGGTFDLRVTATVETGSHVAALIAWSAERDGERIEGRELAVYEVRDGRIAAARFHPENIADDRVFWGEGRP